MATTEFSLRLVKQFYECCRHLALNPESPYAIRKLLVLNMRCNTGKTKSFYEKVMEHLDEEELFVDYGKLVATYRYLENSQFWIHMLQKFCSIQTTQKNIAQRKCNLLLLLNDCMVKHKISISWENTLRFFLLINIERMPSLSVSKMFLSGLLQTDRDKECSELVAAIADFRYTDEEYLETVQFVVNECLQEDTESLLQFYSKIDNHNLEVKGLFSVKSVRITSGRIRLRERLKQKQRNKVMSDHNTFDSFQVVANFASNTSYNSKLALYFLFSQPTIDLPNVFHAVFPQHLDHVLKMKKVETPEIAKINEAISKICYTKAPFSELMQFHEQCFRSIAFTQKDSLSLSTIMQLYVCIYQNASFWQECWVFVLPVMNSQVIRDIDTFRKQQPLMSEDAIIYALKSIR